MLRFPHGHMYIALSRTNISLILKIEIGARAIKCCRVEGKFTQNAFRNVNEVYVCVFLIAC